MEKLNIYFAGSIRGGRELGEVRSAVGRFISKLSHGPEN
jgi:hypothetical protein